LEESCGAAGGFDAFEFGVGLGEGVLVFIVVLEWSGAMGITPPPLREENVPSA
jgi:hypothetical protein